MRLVVDFLILGGAALLPALVALIGLRRGLKSRGPRFWRAASIGLLCLGVLAILALWGAVAFAEKEIATCQAAGGLNAMDCEDAGLLVGLVGLPALGWLVLFMIGAVIVRLRPSRRR